MSDPISEAIEVLRFTSIEQIDDQFILDDNRYEELIVDLKEMEKIEKSTKDKGEKLEKLLVKVLEGTNLFECKINIRTSTNEIDIRAEKSVLFNNVKENYNFNIEDIIYFECKNYKKPIDVTWTGKFHSLLNASNNTLGIFISPKGLTGSKWSDAHGLCKKLYLKTGIKIISITFDDFKDLNKRSLIMIIKNKIEELIEDIDLDNALRETHPNEKKIEFIE
ncbi:restriction endonuclease [Staphylococcus arlettae]|uniref:restriction endonuclease n=1 Tax=Staphylococcus arlettae TaxID=29378 RepID=UPI0021D36E07|nr:restriction endonuclease [Staphylococcus arlettae]UXU48892.1 restriction endonuclease [Staphylococcus arlettae]